ncbi:hypothetical protein D3C76_1744200 [compost metagenome]
MRTVKQDEFEAFIRAIPVDDLETGRDVGRTHGIVCYYADGKHVATERWAMVASTRQFTYEVQP